MLQSALKTFLTTASFGYHQLSLTFILHNCCLSRCLGINRSLSFPGQALPFEVTHFDDTTKQLWPHQRFPSCKMTQWIIKPVDKQINKRKRLLLWKESACFPRNAFVASSDREMAMGSLGTDEKRLLQTVTADVWQLVYMWQWPSEPRMFCLIFLKKDRLWPHLRHSKYRNDSLFSALCIISHGTSEHHRLQLKSPHNWS